MKSTSLHYCLLFSAVVLGFPAGLRGESPFRFADTPGQLPKAAIPHHYALRIQPDFVARTTTGAARIEVELLQPTHELVLNALDLEIDSAALIDDPAKPQSLEPRLDPAKQTLTLSSGATAFSVGHHVLSIAYRGKIRTQAEGLFVDTYSTPSGEKQMLGTQMESTDARRVFPCWDEPVYRATYDLTLTVPEKLMAVSNMPIVRETPLDGDLKEVVFDRTPSMSSYLVGIFVGEFEAVEGEQDGVKLRILVTEGKRASALYALEATQRILSYYNDYFGTRYPLPKLDLIGVPNAFASSYSAMENWGCIRYSDTALLYDPANSTQGQRQLVFQITAHEIAHQWFGNLVTMAWWDNLWLNEGFASWMGTKCSDALNPEWQLWIRANSSKEGVMSLDARKTTHPIQQPIANEGQAGSAFDSISYEKGQSFLRMLETYLGPDLFRAGIRRYIDQHKYSSTTTADLWAALGEASDKPVSAFAAGWTEQPGFPVVLVSATKAPSPGSSAAANETRMLKLEQFRFTLNDPQAKPLTWKIPVTLANTASLDRASVVLLDGATGSAPWPAGGGTVKANVADIGYYRVLYDDQLGEALRQTAASFPVADQLNLLADSWALMENGRLSAPQWLDLAVQFRETHSQPVLDFILARLSQIDRFEEKQPGLQAFRTWTARFLQPQLNRLGWAVVPGEPVLDASIRSRLIYALAASGDDATLAECRRLFALFLKDPKSLTSDLRDAVLYVVGRYADRKTYDQLHALARRAETAEDKARFYGAMQTALDPDLARETLALCLGPELPTSVFAGNVSSVASSEHATLAWDFAHDHMDVLLKRLTAVGSARYAAKIMNSFTDAARADEIEDYVRKNLSPDALREAAKTADWVRHLSAVKTRELPRIDAWIKAHPYPLQVSEHR